LEQEQERRWLELPGGITLSHHYDTLGEYSAKMHPKQRRISMLGITHPAQGCHRCRTLILLFAATRLLCFWSAVASMAATLLAQPISSPPAGNTRADTPLDGRDGRELLLRNFRPQTAMQVAKTPLRKAKFPVVDVHSHFRYRLRHSPAALDAFVQLMDRNQIALCVSLDGRWGDELQEHQDYLWAKYRDRFVIFSNIDWQGSGTIDAPETWACHREDFARNTIERLRDAKRRGVSGVKLFKQFGLKYRNPDGTLIRIDDPRWDPIWRECGQLGLPIILHTADPVAFFQPINEKNERWEELSRHPDWSFFGDRYPSRDELLAARNRVIRRHPRTIFIGAHVANNSEDLAVVSKWLDELPNLHVEFASRIGELGRQPYTTRDFIVKYSDRVLFGTDGPWPEQRIRLYWRFLETRDEYFPYSEKEFPPQGLWNIYGIFLPDDVLKRVYHGNAVRIVPGVREKLEQWNKQQRESGK
jgi:predicted TIM-barrel fold metal-dependent hydrolase